MNTGTRPPKVIVHAPDGRGLRRVSTGLQVLGHAWSPRGLRGLLRREKYPSDLDFDDPASVGWFGGDGATWPDHPWRRRAAGTATAAGLLVSAALLIFIGHVDALGSQTFTGRLTGWLLLLAGAVQTAAVVAVVDFWGKRRWRCSGALVLIGALIALTMSTLLLGMWAQEREFIVHLPLYAALWCWSLWAVWLLCRHRAWRGIPHPRGLVAGVTLSAVLAGGVTAVNFSNSVLYEPNATGALITAEAKLGEPRVSPDGQVLHLPLRVSVKNVGKVPVDVLGTMFWVTGETSTFHRDGRARFWREEIFRELHASRFSKPTSRRLIAFGPFVARQSWIDPGTEKAESKTIQLPVESKFSTIDAAAMVITTRRDRGRIGPGFSDPWFSWQQLPPCTPLTCPTDVVVQQARIHHNNNLVNVTRKARYVQMGWIIDGEGQNPFIQAGIGPLDSGGRVSPPWESADRYGLVRTTSDIAVVPSNDLIRPESGPVPEP